MIENYEEHEKTLQSWCTFGEMENKQITPSIVEEEIFQGNRLFCQMDPSSKSSG